MRKVISAMLDNDDADNEAVLAVCDDGTVWRMYNYNSFSDKPTGWCRLPAIPQDEETT